VHLRVFLQDPLHLDRLDPVPADLELVVGATEVLQRAARPDPDPVAGGVHPAAVGREGIGHELLRRRARLMQVAAPDAGTADVQLARLARRYRGERVIEDV
jgi:hypothetical protein